MKKSFDTIIIYHHLGLGDHITCHGIIRHYCEIYEKVTICVKTQNYTNVKYMFNDILNLSYIIGSESDIIEKLNFFKNKSDILCIGSVTLNGWDGSLLNPNNGNFEEQFYKMGNVPFDYKYNKFYINRNMDKEIELFNSLDLKKGEYIFVHHDGTGIREEYLDRNIKQVFPATNAFFDWIYVIENAKEVHCMDSSFICLVDCLNLNPEIKLFNHRYIRKYPEYIKLGTKKNWIFIK